jgi:biopolymer transport protein ExbD
MRFRSESKIYDQMNLTPLMDLAWCLLIIFMVMATAAVQGIMVDLPRASAAPSLARPKTHSITIAEDGRIYLDTSVVTADELEAKLAAYKAETPDLPVVVRADAHVLYFHVVEVLDVTKRVGITQLGLVTQRLVK